MQASTFQTISTARAILAMDVSATDEDQYCDALCAFNDIVTDDISTANLVAGLARHVSAKWDQAVKHVSADEVRVAIESAAKH